METTIDSPRPSVVVDLTPRQRQIVTLIADDLTAKEIADRMSISPKTVEFHRTLIRHRLGVTGTAGIVRYAIRAGLIQPLTPAPFQDLAADIRLPPHL